MLSFLTIVVVIFFLFISKKIFRKLINPLSIYTLSWGIMVYFYSLKLIPYTAINWETWTVIVLSFFSFFFGILTVWTARSVYKSDTTIKPLDLSGIYLFRDDGKKLLILTWILALLGLFAALHHWKILLDEYGTFAKIFIHSVRVYRTRLDGMGQGLPYIWLASYIAIFLAGLYSVYKGKISFVTVIAVLGIVLKEMARFTRSGILIGFWEFLFVFIFFGYLLNQNEEIRKKFSVKKIVIGVTIIVALLVTAAGFVKVSRNAVDNFKGTSSSLSQFKGGALISPSIYFYLSSHIVVLSKYLSSDYENELYLQNTLNPLYGLISKFGIVEKPPGRVEGFYIPDWSNSATYLRELHNDYGYVGIFVGPYILAMLCAFFWYKVMHDHDLISLIFLVYLCIVAVMSFFALTIKTPTWTLNLIILYLIFKYFQKTAKPQLKSVSN